MHQPGATCAAAGALTTSPAPSPSTLARGLGVQGGAPKAAVPSLAAFYVLPETTGREGRAISNDQKSFADSDPALMKLCCGTGMQLAYHLFPPAQASCLLLAALSWGFLVLPGVSSLVLPPAYGVAFFDDQRSSITFIDGPDSMVQFSMSFVIASRKTAKVTTIAVHTYSHGDIVSEGGLDTTTRSLVTTLTNPPCTSSPLCTVTSQIPIVGWCKLIGKAVTATIIVDDITTSIKAVFGFGSIPSSSCAFADSYPSAAAAIVKLQPVGSSGVRGTVIFQLFGNALSCSGFVTGLKPNSNHGMHVHALGDMRDVAGASNTGMHFAFSGQLHGLVNNVIRHTGDLGNIATDSNGVSAFNIFVPQDMASQLALTLLPLGGSAVGRSIIVHADADDGVSQPTGNSGLRVAQGVIGYASTVTSSAVVALLGSFSCSCRLNDAVSGAAYNGFCPPTACTEPTAASASPGVIAAAVLGSLAFVAIVVSS
jgi:Cu-Zn family superoxide dismutase